MKDPFPEFEPQTAGQAFAKAGAMIAHAALEQIKAKQQYLDSLPAEERAAIVKREEFAKLQREFESFRSGLGAYATALAQRESWTVADFAALLVGIKPDTAVELFLASAQERQREEIRATLQSCVGISLHPTPESAPGGTALYRTRDLLTVARAKNAGKHGFVAVLAGELGKPVATVEARKEPPTPAPLAAPPKAPLPPSQLAAQGLEARQTDGKARRKAQLAVARAFLLEGKGSENESTISLSVCSGPFNARLRELHPEYVGVSDRTLRIDRTGCRPTIILRVGRPEKATG